MTAWKQHLARWQNAGLIDQTSAERIRAFEAAEEKPAGQRWQVLVALIFGGILLGAGVLLFVAAHWDEVSPGSRFALVMSMLAILHLGALVAAERFHGMATVLHGVGTVAAGAAIAMVGQIFNMQEHWPAAILLWAACAAVGYWFLRDQFQQICLMLLAPAWFICEWSYRASVYASTDVYLGRMVAIIAAVYLTAFIHSRRLVVFGVLFGISGLVLISATIVLSEGWVSYTGKDALPWAFRLTAYAVMALTIAAGWLWERRSVIPVVAVAALVFLLPWLHKVVTEQNQYSHQTWSHSEPIILSYAAVAAVTILLAWWGVRENSKAAVNYGVATFALTVAWFYCSSIMDKLGRSLGLIGLGVGFLLGGWLLERIRRRMLQHMNTSTPLGGAA